MFAVSTVLFPRPADVCRSGKGQTQQEPICSAAGVYRYVAIAR